MDFVCSAESDAVHPFETGVLADPRHVWRECVHAGNLIGYEYDAVVAFAEVHRPAEPAPFREPSAVPIKKLHAIVLPIADDQPFLTIDNEGMRCHELARSILAEFAKLARHSPSRLK